MGKYKKLLNIGIIALGTFYCISNLYADQILLIADQFRMPELQTKMTISLESYNGTTLIDKEQFTVKLKGKNKAIIEMQNPKKIGQKVLLTEKEMWLFMPNTRRAIRITPLQRLMGQANFGDIGQITWNEDYHIVSESQDTINDMPAKKLLLEANSDTTTYHSVTLWVNSKTFCPLKADFFLYSGKKFKSAIFHESTLIKGKPVIREITFLDELKQDQKTHMIIENIESANFSNSMFSVSSFMKD